MVLATIKARLTATRKPAASEPTLAPQNHSVPIWLSRSTLLCVLALLTLLWIGLLLLWHFDNAENGLKLSLSSNHLAWTYGPTAILVVVVNIWRQIDYSCKSTQPWRVMSNGPDTAARTIMLDYLWPFQLVSLVEAVRNRHIVVICSIAGFLLLKIITLVSTGLLIAADTLVTRPATIRYHNSFDGTQFWLDHQPTEVQHDNVTGRPAYLINDTHMAYSNLSGDVYYNFLQALNNRTAVPIGFHENLAFQSFSLVDSYNRPVRSRTGIVDVFVPNVSCEAAQLTYVQDTYHNLSNRAYSGFELQSRSCPSYQDSKGALSNNISGVYRNIPQPYLTPESVECINTGSEKACADLHPLTSHDFWRINCSSATEPPLGSYNRQSVFDRQNTFDFRIAMVTLNVSFSPHAPAADDNSTIYRHPVSLSNYSAFVCKIGYAIQKANITVSEDQQYTFSILESHTPARQLDDLTDASLNEIVYDLYYRTGLPLNLQPLFNILNFTANYYNNKDFNAYDLERPLVQSLRGIATMFMLQSYSRSTVTTGQGSVVVVEKRLYVNTAIVFVMVACLMAMCILTITLATPTKELILPLSYDTIAGNAAVLGSSRLFNDMLRSIRLASQKYTEKEFGLTKFRTVGPENVKIELSCPSNRVSSKSLGQNSLARLWVPLSVHHSMIWTMLLLPIVSVIVLEILAQVSAGEGGITTLVSESASTVYVTHYLSTALMFTIATLFNNFDFTIAVLAPFSALASSRNAPRYGLKLNLLGRIPLQALYQSFTHRQFGSTLSIVASTIGSMLTIAVSGLWTVSSIMTVQSAQVEELSLWSVNWSLTRDDSRAVSRFNSIQHGLEISPPTIWDDLVLPNLGANPKTTKKNTISDAANVSSSNYTFTISGLRPVLLCEIVPQERINVTYSLDYTLRTPISLISVFSELPQFCKESSHPMPDQEPFASFEHPLDNVPSAFGWFGGLLDLKTYYALNSTSDWRIPVDLDDCPLLGVVFGFSRLTTDKPYIDNVTALICCQKLQQLDIDVTYLGSPSNNIMSSEAPPKPKESTAIYIKNPTTSNNPFTSGVATVLGDMTYFPVGNGILAEDRFLNHLMWGPGAPTIKDLASKEGPQVLVAAVDKLYRKYMVNVIDLNFRQSHNISDLADANKTNTTIVSGTRQQLIYRLMIDNTSKLILQTMLAVMVILGALAAILVDVCGVLPGNPCSILGTMTLLAGSKLVEDENLHNENQRLLRKRDGETSEEHTYSLGWWQDQSPSGAVSLTEGSNGEGEDNHETDSESWVTCEDDHSKRFGIDVGTADVLGFAVRRGFIKKWRDRILSKR